MRASFIELLRVEQLEQKVALFHIEIDEDELAIFQRWPELQHQLVRLAHPGAKLFHSTYVAVRVTQEGRFLVPAIRDISVSTDTPYIVKAEAVLYQDDGKARLEVFLAAAGFELKRSLLYRLISKVSMPLAEKICPTPY